MSSSGSEEDELPPQPQPQPPQRSQSLFRPQPQQPRAPLYGKRVASGTGTSFGWNWRTNNSSRKFYQQRRGGGSSGSGGNSSGYGYNGGCSVAFDECGNSLTKRRYNVCDPDTGQRIVGKQFVGEVVSPPASPAPPDEVDEDADDDDYDETSNTIRIKTVHMASHIGGSGGSGSSSVSMPKIMAAGVLFYSQVQVSNDSESQSEVHFLLGKEPFHPQWPDSEKWADCGGGVDAKDDDIMETAAREAWEETMGCVQYYEVLLNRLRNGEAQAVFDIQTAKGVGAYRIYLLRVQFADYNTMLNRFRAYLRRHRVQIMDSEKTALQWVSSQEVKEIAQACEEGKNTLLRPNFAKSILAMSRLFDFGKLN